MYCIDHSLVRSVASGLLANSGHFLENLVFVHLRRLGLQIHYYKTKRGREVDFITLKGKERMLIQVCESLVDSRIQEREVQALQEAMTKQKLTTGLILTRRDDKEITVEAGSIRAMPVWKWML